MDYAVLGMMVSGDLASKYILLQPFNTYKKSTSGCATR